MLELLRLLYEFGADLRCFPETVTEMQGILQACSVALKRGVLPGTSQHFLETVQYFASAGYTSADVTRLSGDLPERLAALRIEVVDRPPFDAYQHVIDETVLAEGLARGIYYGRDAALQHDVDAVSAIMRLRRGIKPSSVEDCRALFVTNNPRLARVARAMLHRRAPAASIAPCVTDYALTNLLWLKSPTQAPDLPRKRIMADCLAAVQPSEEIWRAYLDEINRLLVLKHLTQDQYLLLRHSIGARSVLADLTRNDPDCFVEGTVPEVLRRVEAEIASEARSELADERQKRTAAEETSQAQLADERARHDRLRVRARRWASAGTKAVGTLIAILLVVGTFATASWVPDFGPPVFVKAFLLGAQILALAFGTLSLITGTTVKSLARKLEVAVELPIFEMFLRMAGESEEVLSRYA